MHIIKYFMCTHARVFTVYPLYCARRTGINPAGYASLRRVDILIITII